MAKRIDPVKVPTKSKPVKFQLPDLNAKGYLFLTEFWQQALVVCLLAGMFYFNTKDNEYALDDDIVIRQNMYVQKGLGGVDDILTKDAYKSFYESMGVDQQLAGGRYRPLSIVTFALEQEFLSETYGERFEEVRDSLLEMQKQGISNIAQQSRLIGERDQLELKIKELGLELADTRHLLQVFWFMLSMVFVLRFLRNHIFRTNTDIAFLSVLLFVIHPIHTEVIANVKSRDEIFSLMFIVLTLEYFFRYDLVRERKNVLWGCTFFILAFLSKEYAIVLVALIPLGLMIFHQRKLKDLMYLVLPVGTVLLTYGLIRIGIREEGPNLTPAQRLAEEAQRKRTMDPLNEPYMFCKGPQEFLSKINRLDDYVWLLIFPFPLAADYSYQHFPYSDFSDPMVYLSLAVMVGMLYGTWKLWKRRHPLAFAMFFFFGFFILINNLIFDIGATMGERLIYHSSLGFCMMLAWGIFWLAEKIQAGSARKFAVLAFFILIGVPAWMLTVERNAEWKNDETLFIADVKKHPNSALCNGNAGARYMDRGLKYLNDSLHQDSVVYYADIAIGYLEKAVTLHPKYANGWLNLGLCYYNKKDYAAAAESWARVYQIFPNNPILQSYARMLIAHAQRRAAVKDYAGAAEFYKHALRAYPADGQIWLDYAGSSFMSQNFAQAETAFEQAITHTKDPAMIENIQRGYRAAHYNDSVRTLWLSDSLNPDYNMLVVEGTIGTPDFYPHVRRNLERVLTVRPGDAKAARLLDSLGKLEKAAAPPKIDSTKIQ
jgi:protein O-mannosyl-transferase